MKPTEKNSSTGEHSETKSYEQNSTPRLGEKLSRRKLMQSAAVLAGGTAATFLPIAANASLTPEIHTATVPINSGMNTAASIKKNIAETECGKVSGYVRGGIVSFKGIPYGGSTEGKNRFMPPTRPAPWTGVRSSLHWGPVSPQAYTSAFDGRRIGWNHDDESFMFEWEDGQPSEDCLRLNVWTPSINDNRKRPVMVWIHGGGFTAGSGHELKAYDGESLSRRGDVVMVSLNHRLGALGYLDLMDYGEKWASSPNVGILDLIAALNWVKANISNFGGDPGNVLIFGQSGGGSKAGILMAMPEAKGLFHRAVIESGSNLRQLTHERSALLSAAVIAELGLTRETLDKIQEFPNEAIVQAGLHAQRKLAAAGGPSSAPGWGPVGDGKILPRHSWDPDAPSQSTDVPLMVGSVLNEMTNSIQMGDPTADAMSLDEIRKRLTAQRGPQAETILAAFQKAYPNETPFDLFSRIGGMTARMNALTQAERKAAQGAAPAYVYLFQWQTPLLDGRPRAFHCSELPFVFYNTELCAAMTGGGAEALQLSARIADAWISFARHGNPNHPGLPAWPAYSADKVPTMIFDTQCVVKNNPDGPERQAMKQT